LVAEQHCFNSTVEANTASEAGIQFHWQHFAIVVESKKGEDFRFSPMSSTELYNKRKQKLLRVQLDAIAHMDVFHREYDHTG